MIKCLIGNDKIKIIEDIINEKYAIKNEKV